MNKWTKIKVASITFICAAVASCSLVVLLWNVDKPTPISNYMLKFNNDDSLSVEENEQIDNKNKFIDSMKKEANKIIQDYQKTSKNNESLNFYFANLTQSQTQGEINYFSSLDRSLKEISPDLGIVNNQRTPKLINEAFYNKNTELMSFYWSPDYNSVGTWLKYMFTDTYTMPNMWPSTYVILDNFSPLQIRYDHIEKLLETATDANEIDKLNKQLKNIQLQIDNYLSKYSWAQSLYLHIRDAKIPNTNENIFKSPIEILNYIPSSRNISKIQIDDYYVNLANLIGTWVSSNSSLTIEEKVQTDIDTGQTNTIYFYPDEKLPVGIDYVNWIASQNPNIPYQEVGNNSKTPFLCSIGLYMSVNPNADINFRDWYYYKNEFNKNIAKDWWSANPFQSNETAWNGPFSKAPNSLYAQSTWTSLTSWTTIGDENDSNFPEENIQLVANGIMNDITSKQELIKLENEFKTKKTLTFKIRPIPWVNSSGKPVKNSNNEYSYLSPQDFYAGFKAFKRSIDNGMNANNAYFIGLAGINFDKTLSDPKNKIRNKSKNDTKEFKVYFDDPILGLKDILDIFQKQYFMALPYEHVEVQNIVDDNKYNKIAVNYPNSNNIDTQSTDMSKFYGVGVGYDRSVWSDLWSSGSYYVSDVNEQSITYKINYEYFNSFNDVKNNPKYKSFLLENNINNKVVKKLPEINLKYAGSYNLDILYEQFKAGELDKTPLQSINLIDALNNQKKFLRYQNIKKINKSNVIGFNLQIYEKWNEPTNQVPNGKMPAQNIIVDQNGQPMWDPKTRTVTYSIDQYGNYVWPKGKKPKRKSNVSKIYEDLIVSDFYTPLEVGGKSQTIRFAILNTINWVSLKSLVTPGVTASLQYSFMPYGVYELFNQDATIKSTYWDLVANKRYLKEQDLFNFNEYLIKKRMSGNIIWTYGELENSMIKSS